MLWQMADPKRRPVDSAAQRGECRGVVADLIKKGGEGPHPFQDGGDGHHAVIPPV